MKTRDQSRIASLLALLVGIWTILSPVWLSVGAGATTSLIITGAVIIVASVAQYFTDYAVPSWIMGVAAVWLFISAFVFGVGTGAAWSMVLSAIAVVILAYWDGIEVTQLHTGSDHRHHAAL